ncbi:MAG: undecaprenyl/decaprenyl-phosphate alpha-N-acetylglucosaminyl 1-phosphate transferase [Gammaproteobacteria bacterium]|nr:undecaprenyl/decaprenyl-phosphate alpha-N-acetylglucosaminyl 1-phosphate transferase [Gammaproteobacteria bacterium]
MSSVLGTGWLVLLSPIISVVLVVALIPPARRFGMVDHPGGRKTHDHETPLVGGLAIFLTVLAMHALTGGIPGNSLSLLAAMVLAVAIGMADDAHEIGHRSKFIAQLAVALIVVSGTSVHMTHFGDLLGLGEIHLGKWTVLVSIVSIVGMMNAINMIDGVDGLAGSVVLPPMLVYAWLAAAHGDGRTAFELLVLAGATAGFLFFNLRSSWRPRALVFLGDTGSLLLGLLLAWYSMIMAGRDGAAICPITAVWILSVPLLDMGSVMLLRIFRRKSPFHADRQHMHYVLLDAGYSVGQVVGIMTITSLGFGLAALLAHEAGAPESALFLAFLGVWGAYMLALMRPQQAVRWVSLLVRPQAVKMGPGV